MVNSNFYYRFTPIYNYGGKWEERKEVWAKGYAFLASGELISGVELAEYIHDILSRPDYLKLVKELNGRYVAVGVTRATPFILTDRIRSFPVFYTIATGEVNISDRALFLQEHNFKIDKIAWQQFLASGFAWDDRTLFEEIKQAEPSHIIFFHKNGVQKIKYFRYSTDSVKLVSMLQAREELVKVLENVMNRTLRVIGVKPVAIPLTGGYDSRFLATWLKKNNVADVTSFTCGLPESPEFINARKVADELEIRWVPIYHDKKNLEEVFTTLPQLQEYIDFSSNASSMSYFQDIPSMYKLGLSKKTIVVGGHLAGSRLLPFQNMMNKSLLFHSAFQRFFPYFNGTKQEKRLLQQSLASKFDNENGMLLYSIIEEVDFKERQSKFIGNSCRTYDFFAGGTVLPFCDNELVDFFKFLPFQLKLNKNFYKSVLKNYYFEHFNLNFKEELQPSDFDIIKQSVKSVLPSFLQVLLSKGKMTDYCNYSEIRKYLSPQSSLAAKKIRCPNQLIIDWQLQYLKSLVGENA